MILLVWQLVMDISRKHLPPWENLPGCKVPIYEVSDASTKHTWEDYIPVKYYIDEGPWYPLVSMIMWQEIFPNDLAVLIYGVLFHGVHWVHKGDWKYPDPPPMVSKHIAVLSYDDKIVR